MKGKEKGIKESQKENKEEKERKKWMEERWKVLKGLLTRIQAKQDRQ